MFTVDQKDLPDRLKSYTMLDGTPIPNYIVVDIINAAVEAGLVSPPCWEVFGESLVPVTVFKSREDAEEWTKVDNGFRKVGFRHWKGQTE